MKKDSRPLWLPLCAIAVSLLSWPSAAHANWIDDLFTFREDQKPRVAPQRSGGEAANVVQPYYPPRDHTTWSNYYAREDLVAQDFLSSSASKVMRPATPPAAQGGWPAIAEQAAENAQAEMGDGNVVVGEPGESPAMRFGDAKLGRATTIGAPIEDWRKTDESPLQSRPGDYDYRVWDRSENARDPGLKMADGRPAPAETAPATVVNQPTEINPAWKNDPRYVEFNKAGQVSKYEVQRGDTLSGIAGQPAIYNTWKLWPLIYSANRQAIGRNPANLQREQQLVIPRDYTDKQAREAEARAHKFGRYPAPLPAKKATPAAEEAAPDAEAPLDTPVETVPNE